MNKRNLENFIGKYNLAGAAESVTWKSDGTTLSVSFAGDDRNLIGFVSTELIQLVDGNYDIFETAQLRSLLSVVNDDIQIEVVKSGDTPTAFVIKDLTTKVVFVLSDSTVIPVAPAIKQLPTPEISIKLDQTFLTKFVKSVGALRESETFTILADGAATKVVIGYSKDINQTNISIDVETTQSDTISPISFSSKYLRDVLMANKEMTEGTLNVSSRGLAHLSFKLDDFKVDYYLLKIDTH